MSSEHKSDLAGSCKLLTTIGDLLTELKLSINLIRPSHLGGLNTQTTIDHCLTLILGEYRRPDDSPQTLVKEIIDTVPQVRAALRCFSAYFERPLPSEVYQKFSATYVILSLRGRFRKWMKYHLACLFNQIVDEKEMPDDPYPDQGDKPGLFLSGPGYRFLRTLIRTSEEEGKDLEVAASVAHFKKCFPESYSYELFMSGAKCVETLVKPMPFIFPEDYKTPWDRVDSIASFDLAERVKVNCRRIGEHMGEKFRRKNEQLEIVAKLPSFSGHHEASRKDFGAWEEVKRCGCLWEPCNYHESDADDLEARCHCETWDDCFWRSFQIRGCHLPASTVSLKEPLKIRVITKGPVREYFISHQLQKLMFQAMQGIKQFRFTGKPVNEEDLADLLGEGLGDDEFFVSGDYSDATNNIYKEMSLAAAAGFAQGAGLSPDWKRALESTLTEYDVNGHSINRGQLMGSPVSFPILCIANLATYLTAREAQKSLKPDSRARKHLEQYGVVNWDGKGGVKCKIDSLPVAINGDDIAFKANDELYILWRRCSSLAGLEASLGKNFTSRRFVNLNSTCFSTVLPETWSPFTGYKLQRTPCCNFGLILSNSGRGRERKWINRGDEAGCLGDFELDRLGPCHNELMDICPVEKRELITKLFLRFNKAALDRVPAGVPYFAPKHLGGLGLRYISDQLGDRPCLSSRQKRFLRLAEFAAEQGKLNLFKTISGDARVVLPHEADEPLYLVDHLQENLDFLAENEIEEVSLQRALTEGEIRTPSEQSQDLRESRKVYNALWRQSAERLNLDRSVSESDEGGFCTFLPGYNPWSPINVRRWIPFGTESTATVVSLKSTFFGGFVKQWDSLDEFERLLFSLPDLCPQLE